MIKSHFRSSWLRALLVPALVGSPIAGAYAKSTCKNTGSFEGWKREFRAEVVAAGVTPDTIRRTYDLTTFRPGIIRRDRRQSYFSRSFVDFSKRLVSSHRLRTGASKLKQRSSEFSRAEREYGVPAEVITAFWALESDFGAGITKQSQIFDSLATLAYDCRRPELFSRELIAAMKIKTPSDSQIVQFLSGGNQQKVVLGKWLAMNPRVLLLDEPTRGVDIGAKEEIYTLMNQLASQGMAVLFVSSDLEEIRGISDRVLVMHEGQMTGELSRDELSEEAIMQLATGQTLSHSQTQ